MKTTILIDAELWKKFSILVVEERGNKKKNEVIVELIQKYVQDYDPLTCPNCGEKAPSMICDNCGELTRFFPLRDTERDMKEVDAE